MYCTMYYFMLSCVVKTLFLKKEKKKRKKQKSYQAIETYCFGFYDLYKENIFFNNTDVSILDRRKLKRSKSIMTNVFPHRYDLYKNVENNVVFK